MLPQLQLTRAAPVYPTDNKQSRASTGRGPFVTAPSITNYKAQVMSTTYKAQGEGWGRGFWTSGTEYYLNES